MCDLTLGICSQIRSQKLNWQKKDINRSLSKVSTFILQIIPSRMWKDSSKNGRTYLKIIYWTRFLYTLYINMSYNSKIDNRINQARDLDRHFSKEDVLCIISTRICSILLVIKEHKSNLNEISFHIHWDCYNKKRQTKQMLTLMRSI